MLLKWITALQAKADARARRRGFEWAAAELLLGTPRHEIEGHIDDQCCEAHINQFDVGARDALMRTRPRVAVVSVDTVHGGALSGLEVVIPLHKVRAWEGIEAPEVDDAVTFENPRGGYSHGMLIALLP